jgi:hypothetical protein
VNATQDGLAGPLRQYRLECAFFWVDVRLLEVNGRFIASADTADGPSLGCGTSALGALSESLTPFDGVIDQLIASLPADAD